MSWRGSSTLTYSNFAPQEKEEYNNYAKSVFSDGRGAHFSSVVRHWGRPLEASPLCRRQTHWHPQATAQRFINRTRKIHLAGERSERKMSRSSSRGETIETPTRPGSSRSRNPSRAGTPPSESFSDQESEFGPSVVLMHTVTNVKSGKVLSHSVRIDGSTGEVEMVPLGPDAALAPKESLANQWSRNAYHHWMSHAR